MHYAIQERCVLATSVNLHVILHTLSNYTLCHLNTNICIKCVILRVFLYKRCVVTRPRCVATTR